jgi:hypothetical protein
MNPQLSPMRWPSAWKDPAALGLLEGSGIDYLMMPRGADLGAVADQARQRGLAVGDDAPSGARAVKGEWPGVQVSRSGGDGASAGPTGVPWVDSNGWKVRLEAALNPGCSIWVEFAPQATRLTVGAYALAVADAAAHGGRWIVTLDDDLAARVAKSDRMALERWKEVTSATRFFAHHAAWETCPACAVVGVVSDFAGPNEFLTHELLNLLARANQQFTIVPKNGAHSFSGLRALLYVDADAPAPPLRREMLAFADAGGLLIAGPVWGAPAAGGENPRWDIRPRGKGQIAIARTQPEDPYLLASDSLVLVSHRYDLLRFWNAGAVGSYMSASAGRTVAQLVFYASQGPRDATVGFAGRYRSARLWTLDAQEPRRLDLHAGMEIHLPPVNQYAAIELEA